MHRASTLSVLLLLSACRSDPSVPGVTLSPISPTTLDDIVAGVDNCDDCSFRWFKDTVRVEELDGNTVPADFTAKGEEWSVLVTAIQEDGSEGLPGEAKTTVVNSLPEITGLSISPDEVHTNDVLTATVESTDADGDEITVSYAWTVDGETAGEDSNTLDGSLDFDKNQEVGLTVTISDGEESVEEMADTVSVLNTPPSAPEIEISADAVCQEGWSATADGSRCLRVFATSTLSWDDAEAECNLFGGNLARIASEDENADLVDLASLELSGTPGSIYIGFRASSADGPWSWTGGGSTGYTNWLDGEPGDGFRGALCSQMYFVDTTSKPIGRWNDSYCDDIGMESSVMGYACETEGSKPLLCEVSEDSADPDGDEVVYEFSWEVDGQPFTGAESTATDGDTVPAADLVEDGLWTCTVTPSDEDGPGESASAEYDYVIPTYTKLGGGNFFGCLLNESEHELYCWGDDTDGTVSSAPISGVKDISGDLGWHGCIINLNDQLECWGDDTYGQLSGVPSGTYTSVVSGDAFGCALTANGSIDCWGRGHVGQASPPSGTFTQIAAGYLSGCGIDIDGGLNCWGMTATPSVPSGKATLDVSIGGRHSCALDTDGEVYCWQSGTQSNDLPGNEPSGSFVQIQSGANHACALDSSGSVTCWGEDSLNQVSGAPEESGYIDLAGGWNHTCVLHPVDGVYCWGDSTDPVVTGFPE